MNFVKTAKAKAKRFMAMANYLNHEYEACWSSFKDVAYYFEAVTDYETWVEACEALDKLLSAEFDNYDKANNFVKLPVLEAVGVCFINEQKVEFSYTDKRRKNSLVDVIYEFPEGANYGDFEALLKQLIEKLKEQHVKPFILRFDKVLLVDKKPTFKGGELFRKFKQCDIEIR